MKKTEYTREYVMEDLHAAGGQILPLLDSPNVATEVGWALLQASVWPKNRPQAELDIYRNKMSTFHLEVLDYLLGNRTKREVSGEAVTLAMLIRNVAREAKTATYRLTH